MGSGATVPGREKKEQTGLKRRELISSFLVMMEEDRVGKVVIYGVATVRESRGKKTTERENYRD